MYRLINSFFLIICFFFIFCGSSKKIQFSKKYIPIYNPGGEYFFFDQKFSKSYELYQKRQDALKEKTTLEYNYAPKADKLGKRVNQSTKSSSQFTDSDEFTDDSSAMVNSYGIDLARLKGAKFIEVIDDSSYYEHNHEEEKPSFVALLQKIETEFEEIGHDIGSKMKNLNKKKSMNSSNQEAIVNFNNYSKAECSCGTCDDSTDVQEEDNEASNTEIEAFEDELIKDEFTEEEAKIDTE
ncbi:TRP75-related protein [Candidatus Mesenet endosymbiont of Agriotes lineatus]|uniref:TRP75-related protein n=1 Tax=Candidatus Mesenet endosymbiont of Agriotes lineatus TaxID=3077948 RepID=UPI0030D26544